MGDFIGFVWVITCGNSLLSAHQRSTRKVLQGSSTHKQASHVQAHVGALYVQKTWFTIKARGVNEAHRSLDWKNVGKINTF